MILEQPLRLSDGLMLLAAGQVISPAAAERIRSHARDGQVGGCVTVLCEEDAPAQAA
jgi:hypothetical protein